MCEGEGAARTGWVVQKLNAVRELWLESLGVESEVCSLLLSCLVVEQGIFVHGVRLMGMEGCFLLVYCCEVF